MSWLFSDFWCYCDEGYIEDPLTGFCDVEMCDTTFCMHESSGASCASSQMSCDCPDGLSGDHCEIVDHCHGIDCSGHGLCRVIDGASYHCDCEDGWVGPQCSLQMCLDDITCWNGGSCT